MKKIVLLGQALMDYLAEEDVNLLKTFGLKEKQHNLKDFDELELILQKSKTVYEDVGGCVTNTALGLKSACYLCYNIGGDERGKVYTNKIREHSNIKRVESMSGGYTGTVVTFVSDVDDNTTRTCLYNHGCSNNLALNSQLKQVLDSGTLVYISLFSFFGDKSDNIFRMLDYAKKRKSEIILDAGGVRSLEPKKLLELLDYPDGILANLGEVKTIEEKIGMAVNELSEKLWVIVKRGKEPTEMYWGGKKGMSISPKECYEPVNFIGAGDAFAAGLLDTLTVNNDFEKAIENGNERALGVIKKKSFH